MVDVIELISQRVLLTVTYSAKFGFPLNREEIRRRLFRINQMVASREKNEWFPSELIDLAIDRLVSTGRLDFDGKYYRLFSRHSELDSGSQQLHIVDQQLKVTRSKQSLRLPNYLDRQQLLKQSQKKRQQAQPLIEYLAKISWIEGVAITGSLALNAADEKADADFLIITQPNRLWLTRLLVLYFAIKHGKRRSFAHEEPNSWCFNLWLDSHHLFVPPAQHSLYTAYEVCQADWVINRHHTAQKFLLANSWVRQTLPVYYIYRQKINDKIATSRVEGLTSKGILSPVFGLLELVAYASQRLYMKPHQTTERVARGFAWFHPEKKS